MTFKQCRVVNFNCHVMACLNAVLWHCWLGVRKSIHPVKSEWWIVGIVIWLVHSASDLQMIKPLSLHHLTFLVLSYPDCSGKRLLNDCLSRWTRLSSCFMHLFLHLSHREPLGIIGTSLTDWMPFQSHNQLCKSSEENPNDSNIT